MKTRLLSALMTLALALSLLPVASAAAAEEDYTFTNLVVFCKFAGEEEFVGDTYQNATVKQIVDNTYVQSDYSVADYFRAVSGGKMRMQTLYLLDKDGGSLTLSKERAYYASTENSQELLRSELIQDWSGAINTAVGSGAVLVDGSGVEHPFTELDRNGDGYIDLVTVLYQTDHTVTTTHAAALWDYHSRAYLVDFTKDGKTYKSDHFVQLTSQYTNPNGDLVLYRGTKDNRVVLGIHGKICHETAHGLGLLDLYSGTSDAAKVGFMSLMSKHTSPVGQFLSAKEREVLGWIQAEVMAENGSYTLQEASQTSGTVAYKRDLGNGKTLYLEYRRFDEQGNRYDYYERDLTYIASGFQNQNAKFNSGLVAYLATTDQNFPAYGDLEVVSAGQQTTKTDCAVGLNGTLNVTGTVQVTVTAVEGNALTFTISGLPETTPSQPNPDPGPGPEKTPHQVTFLQPILTAVYGDTPAAQTATCTTATLTYSSSAPEVAAVDPKTGALTLRKPGSATITATAAEDESHTESKASYALTISAKALSLNGLRAEGRPYEAGKTDVELTGGTLEGIVNSDQVSFTARGSLASDAAGENRPVTVTATLTGADAEKYTLNPVSGLTVTITGPSNSDPAPDPNPDPDPAPNPGLSGGGGGGMAEPTYKITVKKTQNGKVTPSPKSAAEGEEVTLKVQPSKGYRLGTLLVSTSSGTALPLTAGEGSFTFLMPDEAVTVQATFVDENEPENQEEDQNTGLFEAVFKDVPADSYCARAVAWAVENGITTGVTAEKFAPGRSCTRGEIVTFLYRAAGEPESAGASGFADVSPDSYCARAVAWAVENGITTGVTAEEFAPDRPCTRAESVTFLYRAAGKPKIAENAEFSDVSAENYYASAVAWARENAITDGVGGGAFGSARECTRGEIVTFLFRGAQVN